ncbi:MAG TPA: hypothetical protein VI953_00675 [Candidatus Paceibacterota bacterium]
MDTTSPSSHRVHVATTVIIGILVIAVVGLTIYVSSLKNQITGEVPVVGQTNKSGYVLLFMEDFVNSVLDAPGEVDFETRLRLENEVRETKDAEILAAWKAFTDSKSEGDAQKSVVQLLKILVVKLKAG